MKQTKDTLKTYFETGDVPTELQFSDLIDSMAHADDIDAIPEYTLSPVSGSNKIDLLKDGISVSQIDLTAYLDDTNLGRIEYGVVNPTTGIATITRSDSSTFTIDFSSLIDVQPTKTSELTNDGVDGLNPFITANDLAVVSEYTLSPISELNTLDLLKDGISVSTIDLSQYIDDTNLAIIESGVVNPTTGIATITRSDSSTFTIDFSSLIDVQPTKTSELINDGEVFGEDDRFLLESELNTIVPTYYIKKSLPDSSNAVVGNPEKPYHNLESVINDLPADNGTCIKLFFLSSGIHQGIELPYRNITWDAFTTAEIDFTGVNAVALSNGGFKHIIEMAGNVAPIRNYHFIGGKITISTQTDDKTQIFSTSLNQGRINFSGHLGKFDWKASSGLNGHESVMRTFAKTQLRIGEFKAYSTTINKLFDFPEDSKIEIDKLTVQDGTNLTVSGISNNIDLDIHQIHFETAGSKLSITNKANLKLNRLTGQGDLVGCNVFFNQCEFDTGVRFQFSAGSKISGQVISPNYQIIGAWAQINRTIENFTGKMADVTCSGGSQVIFKGSNHIHTENTLFKNVSSGLDQGFIIENGTTIVTQQNTSQELFSNVIDEQIIVKGNFYHNSQNINIPIILQNNKTRGINIHDENGIKQFRTEDYGIQLEGGTFDIPNKRWTASLVSPGILFVDDINGDDAIAQPFNLDRPYKTLNAAITELKSNNNADIIQIIQTSNTYVISVDLIDAASSKPIIIRQGINVSGRIAFQDMDFNVDYNSTISKLELDIPDFNIITIGTVSSTTSIWNFYINCKNFTAQTGFAGFRAGVGNFTATTYNCNVSGLYLFIITGLLTDSFHINIGTINLTAVSNNKFISFSSNVIIDWDVLNASGDFTLVNVMNPSVGHTVINHGSIITTHVTANGYIRARGKSWTINYKEGITIQGFNYISKSEALVTLSGKAEYELNTYLFNAHNGTSPIRDIVLKDCELTVDKLINADWKDLVILDNSKLSLVSEIGDAIAGATSDHLKTKNYCTVLQSTPSDLITGVANTIEIESKLNVSPGTTSTTSTITKLTTEI